MVVVVVVADSMEAARLAESATNAVNLDILLEAVLRMVVEDTVEAKAMAAVEEDTTPVEGEVEVEPATRAVDMATWLAIARKVKSATTVSWAQILRTDIVLTACRWRGRPSQPRLSLGAKSGAHLLQMQAAWSHFKQLPQRLDAIWRSSRLAIPSTGWPRLENVFTALDRLDQLNTSRRVVVA